ncbi:hypothetical protein ACERIT_08325 [Halopenitus sp. H-Gu1]|uniref:hypothetical protein n=1 Tax=Halopenitus sp. H-Gu1 TaxID=3242697 RepID=UPI00359DD45D
MAREIRFELADEQFEKMKEVKEDQGRTWAGLFVAGVRMLEESDAISSGERLDGLKHEWVHDQRVFPRPGNDRLGSFKGGWTKAENGEEFGPRALNGLSWHNLGWRLGMIFEDTPTDLKKELYQWCVEQQRVTKNEDFDSINQKINRLEKGIDIRIITDSGDEIMNQFGTVVSTNPPQFKSKGTVYTIQMNEEEQEATIDSEAVDRPILMVHLPSHKAE